MVYEILNKTPDYLIYQKTKINIEKRRKIVIIGIFIMIFIVTILNVYVYIDLKEHYGLIDIILPSLIITPIGILILYLVHYYTSVLRIEINKSKKKITVIKLYPVRKKEKFLKSIDFDNILRMKKQLIYTGRHKRKTPSILINVKNENDYYIFKSGSKKPTERNTLWDEIKPYLEDQNFIIEE